MKPICFESIVLSAFIYDAKQPLDLLPLYQE
jgi:hypothetical protein